MTFQITANSNAEKINTLSLRSKSRHQASNKKKSDRKKVKNGMIQSNNKNNNIEKSSSSMGDKHIEDTLKHLNDSLKIQSTLNSIQEAYSMFSQIVKKMHESMMSVIRNL